MKIDDTRKSIGKMVMSYDAGHKLIRSVSKPHGPYLLKGVTKGGMAIIERWPDEDMQVPPTLIFLK